MAGRRSDSARTGDARPGRGSSLIRVAILAITPLVVAAIFIVLSNSERTTTGINVIVAPPPKPVWGYLTDEYTGAAVISATVTFGDRVVQTDGDGEYAIGIVPAGATVGFSAPGYEPASAVVGNEVNLSLTLRPTTFSGRVIDGATGKPISSASIFYNGTIMTATISGTFHMVNVPRDFKLKAMAAGYKKLETGVSKTRALDIKLEPFAARALYFSFYTTGWDERRDKLLSLVDKTELNAVVFDVKGDYGYISYSTNVTLAKQIGAEKVMVKDMDAMVAGLKKRNIYTIARVVVFKDNELAVARPDWAVKARTGGAYIDNEGLRWVDPFRREVWDYNIAIAEEVGRKGFDEVQFDYIRFPSEGSVSGNIYSKQATEESRVAAIAGFLAAAQARLRPLGVFVSADVFGWTVFREDDMGIGQLVERIAPYVDYLSPMLYPSGWGPGSRGISDPVAKPYDIVFQSSKYALERLKGVPTVRVRPWLQDFDDYGPSKRRYGLEEVSAQKKATADAGVAGWMYWNASAVYTEAAFAPAAP